tara:strand:+ start:123 stop:539 length:417 start_codon:yes stop_codon:yes gene_type:complete
MVARAPRKRMYRTMQGRMVDIERLRAANEDTRAVGNMNVNARGDILGPSGNIVTPKSEVIKKYYEQPKGRVDDTPARAKPTPAVAQKVEAKKTVQKMSPVETKTETPKSTAQKVINPVKSKTESTAKKGIDAALDGLE